MYKLIYFGDHFGQFWQFLRHMSTLSAPTSRNIDFRDSNPQDQIVRYGSCAHFLGLRMSLRPLESILNIVDIWWKIRILADFWNFHDLNGYRNPLLLANMLLKCCFSNTLCKNLHSYHLSLVNISNIHKFMKNWNLSQKCSILIKKCNFEVMHQL